MNEVLRLLLLLMAAGAVVTLATAALVRSRSPARRISKGLAKALNGEPDAVVAAPARGRGAGLSLAANTLAVTADAGAWCLLYRLDELVGAEAIVDGRVAARVHRGEARRPLEDVSGAEKSVRLRLVFDDPAHPDFDLDLWLDGDGEGKGRTSAPAALQEANRWLARTEALLRRPPGPRPGAPAPAVQAPVVQPAPVQPAPQAQVRPPPDTPPWEDDEDDEDDGRQP